MTAHTPGEWFVASPEGTLVYSRGDEGAICQLKFLKGRHGLGGRRDPDEVDANARLIATAPKMLKALRRLLYAPDNELAQANDEARAVIAEAEDKS